MCEIVCVCVVRDAINALVPSMLGDILLYPTLMALVLSRVSDFTERGACVCEVGVGVGGGC